MIHKKMSFAVAFVAIMFIFAMTTVMSPSVSSASDKDEDFTLTIMHMNDTHAHVEPMAKMVTAIHNIRDKEENSLLFHAGDVFSGTLYFNEFHGQADLAMMNLMDFDAVTFGNHEFDLGDTENGNQSLSKYVEKAEFPFVSSNVDFSKDRYMDGLQKKGDAANTNKPEDGNIYNTIVKDIDGEKVGIFGLTTESTKDVAGPGDVTFSDYEQAAEDAVDELEGKGIDKIIAVTHIGYDSDPTVGNDRLLAKKVDDIDVIVGGHSHTKLSEPVVVDNNEKGKEKDPTVIVQAYQYSEYLGELDVSFDDDGVIVDHEGKLIDVENTVADKDVELGAKKVLKKYSSKVDKLKNKKVDAKALVDLPNPRQDQPGDDSVRANETKLGNLVTDAMLEKAKEYNDGTVIAMQNGGGIREAINKGPITVGEIISVLPFGNNPVIMDVTGKEIKQALEHSVRQAPAENGGFLHVAGMKFTYDSKKDVGDRVQSMEVKQGKKYVTIQKDKSYLMTTNVFTAKGGDGFDVFANAYDDGRVHDIGAVDWEQLRDYMVDDLCGNVRPEIEGRITDLSGNNPKKTVDEDKKIDPCEDHSMKSETPTKQTNDDKKADGHKVDFGDHDQNEQGGKLPATGSNLIIQTLFGGLFMFAGGVLILIRKRKLYTRK